MIALGYVIFVHMDQAREVFLDIGEGIAGIFIFYTSITMLLWSLSIWYGSRLLGQVWLGHLSDADYDLLEESKRFELLVIITPRVLGGLVWLIFAWAIIKYKVFVSGLNPLAIIWPLICLSIYILVSIYRRAILKSSLLVGFNWKIEKAFFRMETLRKFPKATLYLLAGVFVIYVAITILSFFDAHTFLISQSLGPLAVIGLGLSVFTYIGSWIRVVDIRIKWPITFFIILYLLLVGSFNNNDNIRSSEPANLAISEDNLHNYFSNWYDDRMKDKDSLDSLTVMLVAGEGGGSRASFWTSMVLAHLDMKYREDFFSSVFAMSTVSGSSEGAGFYLAYKKYLNNLSGEDYIEEFSNMSDNLRQIVGEDYLSPCTMPMFFTELVQCISPFSIKGTDRSKFLEDAWARKFSDVTGNDYLNDHYLNMYDQNYTYPINFYNITVVERGMHGLLSPFPRTSNSNVENETLMVDAYFKDIPLKTAMSLSGRFPFFTAPGRIPIENRKNLNFVDGGYYENSGLETTLKVYDELIKLQASDHDKYKFDVKIVFLRNGNGDYFKQDTEVKFFKLLTIPVWTLFTTWSSETAQMIDITRSHLKDTSDLRIINLDYGKLGEGVEVKEEEIFPLTRYLSEATMLKMKNQIDSIKLDFLESKGSKNLK